MHQPKSEGQIVFHTPWFDVLSKESADQQKPHYLIRPPDFASIVALDDQGQLLLVRQYRHGVGAMTLELPSGHVDEGDSPEETARKELLEETGCQADTMELLTTLSPSTARFTNRLWVFFATAVRPQPGTVVEAGIEPVFYNKGVQSLLQEKEFYSAPNFGALCVAILAGKLKI